MVSPVALPTPPHCSRNPGKSGRGSWGEMWARRAISHIRDIMFIQMKMNTSAAVEFYISNMQTAASFYPISSSQKQPNASSPKQKPKNRPIPSSTLKGNSSLRSCHSPRLLPQEWPGADDFRPCHGSSNANKTLSLPQNCSFQTIRRAARGKKRTTYVNLNSTLWVNLQPLLSKRRQEKFLLPKKTEEEAKQPSLDLTLDGVVSEP